MVFIKEGKKFTIVSNPANDHHKIYLKKSWRCHKYRQRKWISFIVSSVKRCFVYRLRSLSCYSYSKIFLSIFRQAIDAASLVVRILFYIYNHLSFLLKRLRISRIILQSVNIVCIHHGCDFKNLFLFKLNSVLLVD